MYEFASIPIDLGASTEFVTIADDAAFVSPLPTFAVADIMALDAPAVTVPETVVLRVAHSADVIRTQFPIGAAR
jgi:hypothetical protein